MDLEATSSSGVAIKTNLDASGLGGVASPLRAGLKIEFTEMGGFLVQARGCYEETVQDKLGLEKELLTALQSGEWNDSWILIDTVVHSDHATILVSDSQNSTIEFAVSGAALPVLPLATASASMSIIAQSGQITRLTGESKLTPFYRASRLKREFWSPFAPPRLAGTERELTRSEAASGRSVAYSLAELSPEDLIRDL